MLKNKFQKYLSLFWILCFGICHLTFAQEQFTPLDKSDKADKDYLTGFIYDAKGKHDPFIPLVTPDGRLVKLEQEEGMAGLSLEGIIYDKNGLSYAVVNGEVVRIGDKVNDYQVLKIEENKVIFIREGQAQEVEFKKEAE